MEKQKRGVDISLLYVSLINQDRSNASMDRLVYSMAIVLSYNSPLLLVDHDSI